VLDRARIARDLGDSAYRSDAQEARLKEKGCTSISRTQHRNKPLTPEQEAANTENPRARPTRLGHIETAMDGSYVRTIGLHVRKRKSVWKSGHNVSRFAFSCAARTPQLRPHDK